jgi:hypothetical protein
MEHRFVVRRALKARHLAEGWKGVRDDFLNWLVGAA